MKNLPLALSIILIIFFGTILGFFVYNKFVKDTSIVQSSSKELTPTSIESSHSLVPMQSNKWYSSIYKDFPSSPMYAYPLAYKISKDGIGISKPINDFKKDTVFATYNEDFVVGFETDVSKPEIDSIGDFSINLIMKSSAGNDMRAFIGQGFPYAVFEFDGDSNVSIKSTKKPLYFQDSNFESEQKTASSDHVIMKIDSKDYVLFFDRELFIEYKNNQILVSNPQRVYIAILDKPESFSLFEKHKMDKIEDTRIDYFLTDKFLETTFSIKSNSENIITSLFPHQFDTLNSELESFGQHDALRGPLALVETNSFTTSIPLIIPSDAFSKTSLNEKVIIDQLKLDIEDVLKSSPPESKNYYLGTWFGMISNLILLSDTYGLDSENKKLIDFVAPILEDSFKYYEYDDSRKSLVSTRPEFGNEELNDHHFHYNYYIRLASILLDHNNRLSESGGEILNLMVRDIANYNRSAEDFPYLRNFDPYEGHSWADGYADANDGNNQESSSEAINAWYSIYLWGKSTNDKLLENTGLSLFNSEINSSLYYWFDKNDIYKEPYEHKIASIVWGGKVDFATWFSPKTNMKYGIQLLPFTPASEYLSKIPNFSGYEKHFLDSGGKVSDEWGDLFLMFKSYHSKVDIGDFAKNLKNYDRNPKSLMYYIVSKNQD